MDNKNKINELEKKIQRFKDIEADIEKKIDENSNAKSHSDAMRIVTDLAAAIFVGFMIGYGIDELANTKPIFMLIFLFIGIIAGFLNVYRSVTKDADSSGK
jgi:ATP synthase protein I